MIYFVARIGNKITGTIETRGNSKDFAKPYVDKSETKNPLPPDLVVAIYLMSQRYTFACQIV